MQIIYFTKFLAGLSATEVADVADRLQVTGLDLAVRAGQCVNPENVAAALPEAISYWRDRGISVPLVTLEGGATDPSDARTRTIFQACGEQGVGRIKLGYWHWRAGDSYWDRVDDIRRSLAGFEELSARFGVCCLVHTHSGACYGCNASSAMHLARGLDPAHVGLYLDPGHLSVVGEPLPMALSIAGEYLRMIAVKNTAYCPVSKPNGPRWRQEWGSLSEGLVDWNAAIRSLRAAGYEGPLSLHGEYSVSEDRDTILPMVERDREFLTAALAASAG